MHVCAKTAFVGSPSIKVSELVLSITSCPSVVILENVLN
jgi:hypothetical protein